MNLFNSKPIQQPEDTLRSIHGIISADMNNQFSSHFMAWEVQEAIKQRPPPPPLKRQDLMICLFYQNYWNLIGKDISQLVLQFLNLASLPPHLNHTFVTLIPKVKCLELVSEYRPISLCNVLYKSFQRF